MSTKLYQCINNVSIVHAVANNSIKLYTVQRIQSVSGIGHYLHFLWTDIRQFYGFAHTKKAPYQIRGQLRQEKKTGQFLKSMDGKRNDPDTMESGVSH